VDHLRGRQRPVVAAGAADDVRKAPQLVVDGREQLAEGSGVTGPGRLDQGGDRLGRRIRQGALEGRELRECRCVRGRARRR
jgi:hypothetical protein